jgi:hypothetical protein
MPWRAFLKSLLALAFLVAFPAASEPSRAKATILVQASPVAGFQYHEGKEVWDSLKAGDALELVREPDNPYDGNAVRVEWQGRTLGYVPRRENGAVARMLDRGTRLQAKIVRLKKARRPWERVLFEVYLEL